MTPRTASSSSLWIKRETRTHPAHLWEKFANWRKMETNINPLSGVWQPGDPPPGHCRCAECGGAVLEYGVGRDAMSEKKPHPDGLGCLPASYFTGQRRTVSRSEMRTISHIRRTVHHVPEEAKLEAVKLRLGGMTFAEIGRLVTGVSSRQARIIFDGHNKTNTVLPEEDDFGQDSDH